MWGALRVLARVHSLPEPLRPGDEVGGVRLLDQVHHGPPMLHFHGSDGVRPHLVSQFYALDTGSFLRWQNEARHVLLPEQPGLLWPWRDWPGGVITLRPGCAPLWCEERLVRRPDAALALARSLALLLARLHALGMAHLRVTPRTVHYRPRRDEAFLSGFGLARRLGWDDYWADVRPPVYDSAWAAPEIMRGRRGDERADAFGFGAVLHWLLSGAPPFGPVRTLLRETLVPACGPRCRSFDPRQAPELAALARACLDPDPANRPGMEEAALGLGASLQDVREALDAGGPERGPGADAGAAGAAKGCDGTQRVLAFLDAGGGTGAVFQAVLAAAGQAPTLALFAAMVPANLPGGHLERYRARLYRELGHGLRTCREQGLHYGLRVFDAVVPSRAAELLVRRYAPDRVVAGRPGSGKSGLRGGVVPRLERLGVPVEIAVETAPERSADLPGSGRGPLDGQGDGQGGGG